MDQSISEPHHLYQGTGEFCIKSPFFFHHPEGVGIVLRCPEAIFCDDMIAEVNYPFDGNDKAVFCTSYLVWVRAKSDFGKFLKIFQPIQRCTNFGSNLSYLVTVKFQISVPP